MVSEGNITENGLNSIKKQLKSHLNKDLFFLTKSPHPNGYEKNLIKQRIEILHIDAFKAIIEILKTIKTK